MDGSTTQFLVSIWVSLILGLVAFAGVWLVAIFMMAETSRWRLLSRQFPANGKPHGRSFYDQVYDIGSSGIISGRRMRVGWVHLVVSPHGLYLAIMFLSRVYPPLLIPWSSIIGVVHGRMWGLHWYRLDVDGMTTIRVGAAAFEVMRAYVPTPVDLAA